MRMTVGINPKVTFPVIGAVLAAAVTLTVWFALQGGQPSRVMRHIDLPVYYSVEELAAASDAVVVGTVENIVGHEVDYGREREPDEEGIPYTFYEIAVAEELRGEMDETIIVARADPNHFPFEPLTVLSVGEQVVLFLGERTAEAAPTMKSDLVNHFYITKSFDNGVFDVSEDGLAHPRWPEAFAVRTGGLGGETLVYTLGEVRAKVQAAE